MAKKSKKSNEVADTDDELNLQDMIKGNKHKYLMINLLANRAGELKRGARSQVNLDAPNTPIELAIAEGVAGSLKVVKREQEKKIVNLVETE